MYGESLYVNGKRISSRDNRVLEALNKHGTKVRGCDLAETFLADKYNDDSFCTTRAPWSAVATILNSLSRKGLCQRIAVGYYASNGWKPPQTPVG